MNKAYVVISTLVDDLIRERQPDTKFYIFRNLVELAEHVETTPIRAQRLFLTKEILQPMVTSSLTELTRIIENPFFNVDEVHYLTDEKGEELGTVNYLLEEFQYKDWIILQSNLNRDYIMNYICGSLEEDVKDPEKMAIYRYKRSDYVRQQQKKSRGEDFNEHYMSEEEQLAGIEAEPEELLFKESTGNSCKIIDVSGIESKERLLFSFLIAQNMAVKGKTVIIEKDYDYLSLSDLVARSEVDALVLSLEDLYKDCEGFIRKIRFTKSNLIVLTVKRRCKYDYGFISNLIYNNLEEDIAYLVLEKNLNEVASTSKYIVVLPNDVVSVLKTIELLPEGFKENASYISVDISTVDNMKIKNKKQLGEILTKTLGYPEGFEVEIVKLIGTKIGGEAHDLSMLIK